MANPYLAPGVEVTELQAQPSVLPFLASPADICVIGLAGNETSTQTPLTRTDTMILAGTSAQPLPFLEQLNDDAVLVSVLSVLDVLNPAVGTPLGAGYTVTTDYTVQAGEADPDGNSGTITRVGSGSIPDGTLVSVTYTYTPSNYWDPVRFFDQGSVQARYGNAWNNTNTGIGSQLSMGALLAFQNGAQSVICQPLFTRATPGDPTTAKQAPTATQFGSPTTWGDTLYSLRPVIDLNIMVPIIGQDGNHVSDSSMLNIFGQIQQHIFFMNSQEQFIVGIFGEDGTVTGVGNNTSGLMHTMRNSHAQSLQGNFGNSLSSQCVLLNNTVFQLPTPLGNGTVINVGGQYAAAAFAGAVGGRAVAASMTRKPVLGFASVTDPRTPSDKDSDAGAGLCVIEQVQGVVRCRQSNTLDILNGAARAELNVVRAKFMLVESIRQTLDNQIIGNIIADANSPIVVRSAIGGILSLLQDANIILGYSDIAAALTNLNPTTVTASFSYQPAFSVNNVKISFSLDLTNGAVTVNSGG